MFDTLGWPRTAQLMAVAYPATTLLSTRGAVNFGEQLTSFSLKRRGLYVKPGGQGES